MIKKDCDDWKFSSNINEVIRAVLNFLFFIFLQKDFERTKSTKSTKTQPNKSTKTEISEQK